MASLECVSQRVHRMVKPTSRQLEGSAVEGAGVITGAGVVRPPSLAMSKEAQASRLDRMPRMYSAGGPHDGSHRFVAGDTRHRKRPCRSASR